MSDVKDPVGVIGPGSHLSPAEQAFLGTRRVAIDGLDPLGVEQLFMLIRLGIHRFHLHTAPRGNMTGTHASPGFARADPDELMTKARGMNPAVEIRIFGENDDPPSEDRFLEGIDLFIDALPHGTPMARRRQSFALCGEYGITAITTQAWGQKAAAVIFPPDRMSFEEFFRPDDAPEDWQWLQYIAGLFPISHLVEHDPLPATIVDSGIPASSTLATACCATQTASLAQDILLQRGKGPPAPCRHIIDIEGQRHRRSWLPWGNRNPWQRLRIATARRRLASARARPTPSTQHTPGNTLERILEQARWAPSGSNQQPWRFEITGQRHVVVQGRNQRSQTLYDLQGHVSQLSLGALLESIELAASAHGMTARATRRQDSPDLAPVFDVRFKSNRAAEPHPLAPYLAARATQRRPLSRKPLHERHRRHLEAALSPGYRIIWLEGRQRWALARLLFDFGLIRLATPEAYRMHREIIEWNAAFSHDRLPDLALGLHPLTLQTTRWVMKSWRRAWTSSRYLGGTLLPRLQMDVLPALRCAAHFLIVADHLPSSADDYIAGGREMQRFWLTATRCGLQLQPEMTPLIYAAYVRDQMDFSEYQPSIQQTIRLTRELQKLVGREAMEQGIFMGRLGYGPMTSARSLRLPLDTLIVDTEQKQASAHETPQGEQHGSSLSG
ncbi:nitroreductase family protein [Ectothiorhodospira variabilis]|uniref:nitroreductase family protein n=1 Tax=Ectothiorhodospira variabilis TaxID=505694 RepID=UPI001EFBCA68|nr:nitroreductase family protein [Ectothiorhodospira variabilis]MCG5495940.1 nitroreductase family protein [Ectothiorhodospira variabilis]MCG5505352.1 nitroreductase family protein [Ectothiorhodospira variabilis]MCG5508538.1 nitroreductase family protein [Ectothiorhodospira variabilis]